MFGLPSLGDILGGSGGGGLPGLPHFPGMPSFPGFLGMGGQPQGGYSDGGMGGPYQTFGDPNADSTGLGGTMNLQALLDMMQRNQQGAGGGQSYIGGQGLI